LLLVPPGLSVVATASASGAAAVLALSDRELVLVKALATGTTVGLLAATRSELDDLEARVAALVPADASDALDPVVVWRRSSGTGFPVGTNKRVELPRWPTIARNYPAPVRERIDAAMAVTPPVEHGRLLLWHGLPGTGKTTAALALLDAWRPWCDGHLVTDPERLFEDSSYLLDVLTSEGAGGKVAAIDATGVPERRWKLVIAEDTEEFLRSDARVRTGAALSRVLNATDGVLARGTRALVLFTTNEERGRLHPAITRPGRCLSVIEFTAFNPTDAGGWLGTPAPRGPLTLAELFEARRSDDTTTLPSAPVAPGQYL